VQWLIREHRIRGAGKRGNPCRTTTADPLAQKGARQANRLHKA
jgi:hypothetical protein